MWIDEKSILRTDRIGMVLGAVGLVLGILALVLALTGCGGGAGSGVARGRAPVMHTELTSDEYNDAEAHFAGADVAPMPPEWKGGYTDRECQELLDKRDGISYVLMGLGVLTGGSGLTAVIPKDMEKEKKEGFEIAFGSLTLAFGVADAVLVGVLKTLSARYERNCMTETTSPTTEDGEADDRRDVGGDDGAGAGDAGLGD